jgi:NCAIR mutase (PurE)-related protein
VDEQITPLESILEAYKAGTSSLDETLEQVNASFFERAADVTVDHDRSRRTGAPEVIYGEHKTPEQILRAFNALRARGDNVLVTRVQQEKFKTIESQIPDAKFHDTSRSITFKKTTSPIVSTKIAIVTAGTSDSAVAEEAAVTCEFYDNPVIRISDVGVAGIHRLLSRMDELRDAKVLVVVAGMEGALPSVVGGLVDKPVIAVPTSVGYGASFGGVSALLGMLNSCASGVAVVNIDNGFGAGFLASQINHL